MNRLSITFRHYLEYIWQNLGFYILCFAVTFVFASMFIISATSLGLVLSADEGRWKAEEEKREVYRVLNGQTPMQVEENGKYYFAKIVWTPAVSQKELLK